MRLLFASLALSAVPAFGQIQRSELPELERSLTEDLVYLASDELGGRLPGSDEGYRAAKFIQARFEELQLEGAFRGEYTMDVEIPVKGILPEAGNFLKVGGVSLALRAQYWPHVLSDNREIAGSLTWMGFGSPAEIAKAKKGSIAVMIAKVPEKKAKKMGSSTSLAERIKAAREHGAQAIILLDPVNGKPSLDVLRRMRPIGIPVVNVHDLSACKALKSEAKKSTQGEIGVHVVPQTIKAPNVGAWINRGMPETIVIGAHYDHVGWGEWGSRTPERAGEVHNGADDNASGTSAVLALANHFARTPGLEQVNLAFVLFTGEESGLLGSRAMVAKMPENLGKVKAMVNLDMVGRLNRSDSLRVYGAETAVEFKEMLQSIPTEEAFYWDLRSEIFARSDHASFIRFGVPSVFFFTGLHEDYHAPTDDIEKLDINGIAQVVDRVQQFIYVVGQSGPLSLQLKDER
jgi:hypothetical protein